MESHNLNVYSSEYLVGKNKLLFELDKNKLITYTIVQEAKEKPVDCFLQNL